MDLLNKMLQEAKELLNEQDPKEDLPPKETSPDEDKPKEDKPPIEDEEPEEDTPEEQTPLDFEKLYLGRRDDKHFYVTVEKNEEDEAEDLQIVDQEGNKIFSAKENDIDINNVSEFIKAAIEDGNVDIAQIERNVVMQYLIPPAEEIIMADEEAEEELEPDLDLDLDEPTESPTQEKPPMEKAKESIQEYKTNTYTITWRDKREESDKGKGQKHITKGYYGRNENEAKRRFLAKWRDADILKIDLEEENVEEAKTNEALDMKDWQCQECGYRFNKKNPPVEMECPKCGGYDVDVDTGQKTNEAKMGIDYVKSAKASMKKASAAMTDKDHEQAIGALEDAADDCADAAKALKKMKRESDSKEAATKDKEVKEAEDKLSGGLADAKSPEDFDQDQLRMGIEVEMEHTDDSDKAREIAMDHLVEDPEYYTKLQKIENESKTDEKCKSKGKNMKKVKEGNLEETVEVKDPKGNKFSIQVVEEGNKNTVLKINQKDYRFDTEFAQLFGSEDGKLTEQGMQELALETIRHLNENDYAELIGSGKVEEACGDDESSLSDHLKRKKAGLEKEKAEFDKTWNRKMEDLKARMKDARVKESKMNIQQAVKEGVGSFPGQWYGYEKDGKWYAVGYLQWGNEIGFNQYNDDIFNSEKEIESWIKKYKREWHKDMKYLGSLPIKTGKPEEILQLILDKKYSGMKTFVNGQLGKSKVGYSYDAKIVNKANIQQAVKEGKIKENSEITILGKKCKVTKLDESNITVSVVDDSGASLNFTVDGKTNLNVGADGVVTLVPVPAEPSITASLTPEELSAPSEGEPGHEEMETPEEESAEQLEKPEEEKELGVEESKTNEAHGDPVGHTKEVFEVEYEKDGEKKSTRVMAFDEADAKGMLAKKPGVKALAAKKVSGDKEECKEAKKDKKAVKLVTKESKVKKVKLTQKQVEESEDQNAFGGIAAVRSAQKLLGLLTEKQDIDTICAGDTIQILDRNNMSKVVVVEAVVKTVDENKGYEITGSEIEEDKRWFSNDLYWFIKL